MSEIGKYGARISVAAALLLGSNACSDEPNPQPSLSPSEEKGTESQLACTVMDRGSWSRPPEFYDPQLVAQTLNLSAEETAQNGIYGPVHCPDGITTTDIETGQSSVSVPEMNGPCVIVGLLEQPEVGREYQDALAICVPNQEA